MDWLLQHWAWVLLIAALATFNAIVFDGGDRAGSRERCPVGELGSRRRGQPQDAAESDGSGGLTGR